MATQQASIFAEIVKVDKEKRLVTGYASTTALDLDGQRADAEWLKSAIPEWMTWGNIREMHGPSAVGVAEDATIDQKGAIITAKIVDDDAWKKVAEGVYKGFSIGVKHPVIVKDASAPNGLIKGGTIVEVSLVDRPANPECVLTVAKAADGEWQPGEGATVEKAVWSTAYINDLPDSAFAYIEPGGEKDSEGKTVPRSKRHLPYKDKDGKIDPAHVRNALARLDQTDIPEEAKAKARRRLVAAAKEVGIEVSDDAEKKAAEETLDLLAKALGMTPDELKTAMQDAVQRAKETARETGDDGDGDVDNTDDPKHQDEEQDEEETDATKAAGPDLTKVFRADAFKAAVAEAVKGAVSEAVRPLEERLKKVEELAAPAKAQARPVEKSFAANGDAATARMALNKAAEALQSLPEEERIKAVAALIGGNYGGAR
ncbi:MAG: hypothetical protein QJR03_12150 [Sphaerobacter sp.]|nr:hypothetical protein [Sphaerobacter sp.]